MASSMSCSRPASVGPASVAELTTWLRRPHALPISVTVVFERVVNILHTRISSNDVFKKLNFYSKLL